MIGTKEGVYRCRTVKRRAEELSYDPNCTDYLNIKYDEYILKGAKTRQHVSMPRNIESQEIPTRGREFVPRRLYMMPKDYERYGFTQGCRGCAWAQNQIGARAPHSEQCRQRMEGEIGKDEDDIRMKKVQERQDHFAAMKVAEGEDKDERVAEPRQVEKEEEGAQDAEVPGDVDMQDDVVRLRKPRQD